MIDPVTTTLESKVPTPVAEITQGEVPLDLEAVNVNELITSWPTVSPAVVNERNQDVVPEQLDQRREPTELKEPPPSRSGGVATTLILPER